MLKTGQDISHYPHVALLTARFGDLDADGCLSETGLARYVEQARSHVLTEILAQCGIAPHTGTVGMLVAHVGIQVCAHHAPRSQMQLATGVSRIGRTSVNLRVGIFSSDSCIAVADNVMVFIARDTNRPIPVPEPVVARLQQALCR